MSALKEEAIKKAQATITYLGDRTTTTIQEALDYYGASLLISSVNVERLLGRVEALEAEVKELKSNQEV